MGFSKEVKDEILVASARHCCVCHKATGLNIEVHHIIPRDQDGDDTIDNAIALCFDCHADAGHYFARHPKGIKLSPEELKKHKAAWFQLVRDNNILPPNETFVELKIDNEKFDGSFYPIFIKKTTRYADREKHVEGLKLLGMNPMKFVNDMKSKTGNPIFIQARINKIHTYDDYLDFLNDDTFFAADQIENCQPVLHRMGLISAHYKEINKSNCVLKMSLINHAPQVLDDFKLYLRFKNVISLDSVNKHTSLWDTFKYDYNVHFDENKVGTFIPVRNTLVQKDSIKLDAICFRPDPNFEVVEVEWELFARNFHSRGRIELPVKPTFEYDDRIHYVKNMQGLHDKVELLSKIEISYD